MSQGNEDNHDLHLSEALRCLDARQLTSKLQIYLLERLRELCQTHASEVQDIKTAINILTNSKNFEALRVIRESLTDLQKPVTLLQITESLQIERTPKDQEPSSAMFTMLTKVGAVAVCALMQSDFPTLQQKGDCIVISKEKFDLRRKLPEPPSEPIQNLCTEFGWQIGREASLRTERITINFNPNAEGTAIGSEP